MTKLLSDDDEGEGIEDPLRVSRSEPRGGALLNDLVSELAVSSSGLSFIATCLDRVIETWDLSAARAVVNDSVLGLQIFNAGRRPFELHEKPSALVAARSGIYTEPSTAAAEIDAVARLCEIALRLDRLRYESRHDPLTGLYNRRGFDEHLRTAVSRSVRYGWSFGLVLLDLNGFKAINDSFGHQHGDAVLRQVGDQLGQGVRSGDIAARVGGDEFALLLPIEEPAAVDGVLERCKGASASLVAWTAGLAMCPADASTLEDLYRIADDRLYQEKVRPRLLAETMEIPAAIALTGGRARSRPKTVKAAAVAAMALVLSGGIAAAATGNLPGQSHARHERTSGQIEQSGTTGNRPGPSDSRRVSTSEPEGTDPSTAAQSAATANPATANAPSSADASGTSPGHDDREAVARPSQAAGTDTSGGGAAISEVARGGNNPPDAPTSTDTSHSSDSGSDGSESATDGQHRSNHGGEVSAAAQTCPTRPRGQHGQCVSVVAHIHEQSHQGSTAGVQPPSPVECVNRPVGSVGSHSSRRG